MTPMLWFAMWMAGGAEMPQAIDPTIRIEVAVRTYRADGSSGSSAGGTISNASPQLTWVDPTKCGMGAGALPAAEMGASSVIVWEYTGHVVQQTESGFVVEVEIKRRDRGAAPPRSITIGLGERVILDELPAGAAGCFKDGVRLEVGVIRVRDGSGARSGGGGGRAGGVSGAGTGAAVGAAGGGGGRGGGSGVATGGVGGIANGRGGASVGISDRSGTGMTAAMFAAAMGMGESGTVTKNGVPITDHSVKMHPIDDAAYDAEVWLVHRLPQGQDETLKQTGHIGRDGRVFEFPAMHVSTDAGVVDVSVAGMLRPMTLDDGTIVLRAAIARVLGGAGNSTGSSVTAIPMPGPSDAVSFETPLLPARFQAVDPLSGHQFSVLVRLAHK